MEGLMSRCAHGRDYDGKEDAERWGKEGEREINGRARVWLTLGCESSIKDTSF